MEKHSNNKNKTEIDKKKMNKENTKRIVNPFTHTEVIFLVIVTTIVSILMTYVCTKTYLSKETTNTTNIKDNSLQEFIDTYQNIVDSYYKEVDKQELIDNAIKGMLSGLDDPYSTYLDKTTSSNFDASLAGTYQGVGLEVYNDKDMNIIVSRVFENSSAAKAGIEEGDIIKKIDDKNLTGKETTEFSDYAKTKKSGEFTVVYVRDGQETTAKLKRSIIIIQSVSSKTIMQENHKIGYIKIDIFSATTYSQLKKTIEKLEKENIEGMIIDVRDNTGGHLTVVSDMLSLMMDKSHVIYQIENKGKKTKYYSTGKKTKQYPIVILQNSGSASASELFTAAMKEEYGAKVVGTKSYGKGTVQELNTLQDGTQYKFTTKKWLTPKGNWIHEKGITPDENVELDEKYFENPTQENDNQLQKALYVVNQELKEK